MNPKNRYISALPIIFLLFSLFSLALSAKLASINSNIEIISNALDTAANSLITQIGNSKSDTVYTSIKTSAADRYFNTILIGKANDKNITFYIADTIANNKPYLDITLSIETNYQNYKEDSDSLVRTINIIWTGSFRLKDNKLQHLELKNLKYRDIILRDDADKFNSDDFDFANASIPEPPASFWKDIIQPIAIISTAVITVVLLFTLRSN